MIDHSDGNPRILQDIELARILSQLYAANQVERAKNDACRNISRNDQCCVTAVFHRFNDESVVFNPTQFQLVGSVADPTRRFGCSQNNFRTGDGLCSN